MTINVGCKVILDIILLILLGIPIVIFKIAATPYRRGFFCDDETIKHPFHDSTISTAVLFAVGVLLPITTMIVVELVHFQVLKRRRVATNAMKASQYTCFKRPLNILIIDLYKVIGSFLFGAAASQMTTDIIKYSAGRLRPHFLDVCKPKWESFNCTDKSGYMRYVTEDVCTGDHELIREARLSHVSGHASFSCYCMIYLALYLQSRMRWRGSHFFRPFCQCVVLYMALYTCVSRVSDYKHHHFDVIAGAIQGGVVAILVSWNLSPLYNSKALLHTIPDVEQGAVKNTVDPDIRPLEPHEYLENRHRSGSKNQGRAEEFKSMGIEDHDNYKQHL